MDVDILFPLTRVIQLCLNLFLHITKTLEAWIGHNEMRYHNLNALPPVLPYALQCNFSQFIMV